MIIKNACFRRSMIARYELHLVWTSHIDRDAIHPKFRLFCISKSFSYFDIAWKERWEINRVLFLFMGTICMDTEKWTTKSNTDFVPLYCLKFTIPGLLLFYLSLPPHFFEFQNPVVFSNLSLPIEHMRWESLEQHTWWYEVRTIKTNHVIPWFSLFTIHFSFFRLT